MTLGDKLKFAREKAELKQVDVMKITNINNKTLSNWEKNVSNPDPESLKLLAKVYNVSVDYLLGNDSIEQTKKEITDAVSDDAELLEFWNELKKRDDLKLLCKQTKSLSPATIKRIIKYIKIVEDEESQDD